MLKNVSEMWRMAAHPRNRTERLVGRALPISLVGLLAVSGPGVLAAENLPELFRDTPTTCSDITTASGDTPISVVTRGVRADGVDPADTTQLVYAAQAAANDHTARTGNAIIAPGDTFEVCVTGQDVSATFQEPSAPHVTA